MSKPILVLLVASLALLTVGCGSDSVADAARTKACRSYELMSGGGGPEAADEVGAAAEDGTFDAGALHQAVGPVVSASRHAALEDGLSDSVYDVFRTLNEAGRAVLSAVDGPGSYNDTTVVAFRRAVTDEASACRT